MIEYQSEVESSRHCLLDEDNADLQELEEEIARLKRNRHGVHRAALFMAALTALALTGLGYPAFLLENFPYAPRFIVNLAFALGLASLINLLICVGLGMAYRRKLDQRKEACLRLLTKLLTEARAARHVDQNRV
jgi:hypothetical protein